MYHMHMHRIIVKVSGLLLLFVLAGGVSRAQEYRYGIGLTGGGTIGVSEGDEIAPSWGFRGLFRYALLESLHLELGAGYMIFKDDGSYLDLADVETTLIPIDLRAILTPWANDQLSPYAYAGLGFASFDVVELPLDRTPGADTSGPMLMIPLGVGLNYRLSLNWALDLQVGSNLTLNDDLNPKYDDINDAWWSGMVGVIYSFGGTGDEGDESVPQIRRDVPFVLEGIEFETGSASIKPESVTILRRVLRTLELNPEVRVEISGHTDSVGTAENNQDLSMRRAESVKQWFIRNGVAAGRMETIGYGETRPRADNGTAEGRARNRRIEMRRID